MVGHVDTVTVAVTVTVTAAFVVVDALVVADDAGRLVDVVNDFNDEARVVEVWLGVETTSMAVVVEGRADDELFVTGELGLTVVEALTVTEVLGFEMVEELRVVEVLGFRVEVRLHGIEHPC